MWRLFERVDDSELKEALEKMQRQIEGVGGTLTFYLKIDNEGWFAKCKEFDGIITGGANGDPSEEEVLHSIVESVKTAFDVPIQRLQRQQDAPTIPTVLIEERKRELQFA